MKRWFGAGVAKYVGIDKTNTQHLLEAIAYNLYRSVNIYRNIYPIFNINVGATKVGILENKM